MILTGPVRLRYLSLVCAFAAGLLVSAGCQRNEPLSAADGDAKASSPKPVAVTPEAPAVVLEKLRGRWLRPDGGYVLAIESVDADGRAEARYFNPSPIRVAWARARADGGQAKLEVELRDTNYPGCLYKLGYLPETDRLVGTYFQAQMQQTHEVFFIRQP